MASTFAFQSFSTIFLLSLILGKALSCTYDYKDIEVSQAPTGKKVNGKTEYEVTVANDCPCIYLQVQLSSPGFQTVEPVDPNVVKFAGDVGVVSRVYGSTVFKYAWDTPFKFTPIASQIACS